MFKHKKEEYMVTSENEFISNKDIAHGFKDINKAKQYAEKNSRFYSKVTISKVISTCHPKTNIEFSWEDKEVTN